MPESNIVNLRYLVDDVACVDYYTRHFGFTVGISSPAFADVTRGNLRLLLSGPLSSAGRAMKDGERPGPGGWNRIHLIVDDLDREVTRLTECPSPWRSASRSHPPAEMRSSGTSTGARSAARSVG